MRCARKSYTAISKKRDLTKIISYAAQLRPSFHFSLADWIRACDVAIKKFGIRGFINHIVMRFRRGGIREIISVSRAFVAHQSIAKHPSFAPGYAGASPPMPTYHPSQPSIPTTEGFRLTTDYTIEESKWLAYLNLLFSNCLSPTKRIGPITAKPLVVVVDCHHDNINLDDIKRTLASINNLVAKTNHEITCYLRYEESTLVDAAAEQTPIPLSHATAAKLSQLISYETPVLWLKPGDEVHPEIAQALDVFGDADSQFTLIDIYWTDTGTVHPMLFNGVDQIQAESVCYFLGRFVTTGYQIALAIRENPYFTAEHLGQNLACRRDLQNKHIALPLIKANVTREEYRAIRASVSARENKKHGTFIKSGRVSAIVCTKNSGLLLEQLIRQLMSNPAIEDVIVVANNPTNDYALAVIDRLRSLPQCKVLDFTEEFNFSKQSNLGAKHASGEHFLFINDDIAPVTTDWLAYLLSWMDAPRIAGSLLVYPDQTIQHAGMFMGFNGVAGHALRGGTVPDCDPNFMLVVPRKVSCLTGAVMLMPREVFEDLNGFDIMLGTYLQDVDLCMRAAARDIELVFDPRSILIHVESVSISPTLGNNRAQRRREREFSYFLKRWGDRRLVDKHLNPLIDVADETLTLLKNYLPS